MPDQSVGEYCPTINCGLITRERFLL